MLPNDRDPLTLATRLERAALAVLTPGQPRADALAAAEHLIHPERFTDELGNARPTDALVIRHVAHCLRLEHASTVPSAPTHASADAALWQALLPASPIALSGLRDLLAHATTQTPDDPAPAIAQPARTTIEVWTETELCGLHALWWHAQRARDRDLLARVDRARAYLTEHIQPDNATNHPWAIHVFALAAARGGDGAADLFAQQLLHNCVVSTGLPDRRSAWILLDAALALRASAEPRA